MRSSSRGARPWIALLAACALSTWAVRTRGAVLEVALDGSAPFTTIQSAIDAAVPGMDDVFVHCGTYHENLVIRDGVSLRGAGPNCAVIDGGGRDTAVRLSGIGSDTLLEGFTITHGTSMQGGGILIEGGAPVITRNVIAENGSPLWDGLYDYGGGIRVVGSAPGTAPRIAYNVIRDNTAFVGGGIYLGGTDGAVISSNLIADNTGSFGGGIYSVSGSAAIVNNTIVYGYADYGGGIAGYRVDLLLINNVLAWNLAHFTPGDVYFFGPNTLTLLSNDTFGNLPYDAYPGGMPGSGNISDDPAFVDTYTDSFLSFQPRSFSPLIDAGSSEGAPQYDLRGLPRALDGNASGTGHPDIGARENEGLTGVTADVLGFHWDAGLHEPSDYNIYRGDLQVLRETGTYTQDPKTVPGAQHYCDWGFWLADRDLPEPGEGYFFIPVAWGNVEGSLGFDSQGLERPKTLTCQGP